MTEVARLIREQAVIFDTPDQAVIATTLDGRIVFWNQAATRIYGWAEDETIGRNIEDVTPNSTSMEEAAEIMELLRAGKSWTGDFTVRDKHGSSFVVRVCDLPVRDANGHLAGIVGISWPSRDTDGISDPTLSPMSEG